MAEEVQAPEPTNDNVQEAPAPEAPVENDAPAEANEPEAKSEAVPSGAAKVSIDTSKDAHWDLNNRTPEQKAKDSGNKAGPKPEGNAPDAGMTPEEADKKFNQPKEQVTALNGEMPKKVPKSENKG